MTRRWKWAICAAGAVLLLTADALLTWKMASDSFESRASGAGTYGVTEEDPLDRFRLEREQLRAREEAQLNEIIHSTSSDDQIVSEARRRLMELMDWTGAESAVEGILRGRGFGDVLVSVSRDSANVLVRAQALTAAQTAVILDLVMRQTGLTGGNVKIIPVK